MKIGILTHHYINNYGAFLQAWALREAVQEFFPAAQVQIIDYINRKHFVINAGGWFRFYREKENINCWIQKTKSPWIFAKMRKEEMSLSPACFNAKQINALGFDCIVFGSDEIWNYKDRKGNAPIKFGAGLQCGNLIAYAPSVGNAIPDEGIPPYAAEGIRKFKALSARDDLTCQLIKKVSNIDAPKVLDPTFLAAFPQANLKAAYQPYILFYDCDLPPAIREQIFAYAGRHGLAVYGAGECNKEYSEITVGLTPFEWIEMFRNAEFVFTGTFHGAVFSILNRRPFKVYLTDESRAKKVDALLMDLKISGRYIGPEFCFSLDAMRDEIDYDAVYTEVEQRRKESLTYLKRAVGQALGKLK